MEEGVTLMGRQIKIHIQYREVELELNRLRALKHQMNSTYFKRLYDVADLLSKQAADEAIARRDPVKLKAWIKERRTGCLEGCSVRDLRDMARAQQIPNYSRLSKVELIRKIQRATDEER